MAIAWLLVGATAQTGRAEIDWQPAKTHVFAVGLLEWEHSKLYPSFPDDVPNRCDRRLVELLHSTGVPRENIVYLEDRAATKHRIEREFAAQLARTQPGDMLVFYFAGHGSRDMQTHQTYFANYDAGNEWSSMWPVRSIFETIERHFRGDRVLLLADCCHSGALYDEAQRRASRLSYACLTSCYSHNSSTGAWTFTAGLLKGFAGDPAVDANGDHEIELREIAQYVAQDLAFFDQQKSMFLTTGDFAPGARMADARGSQAPGLGRRIEVLWKDKWYRAQITGSDSGRWRVHYAGYDASWDEWVTADRMRPWQPRTWSAGSRIEVHWSGDGKWYPATVLSSHEGLHKVHYDGYSQQWDEWVGSGVIRSGK